LYTDSQGMLVQYYHLQLYCSAATVVQMAAPVPEILDTALYTWHFLY
jgi:hypothetical protein